MNILSNVVACGDGLISGGATVICVQSTIFKTGCSGYECSLPSGSGTTQQQPTPTAPAAAAAGGARRTAEHAAKKQAHAKKATHAQLAAQPSTPPRPVEQLEVTYDRVPTVNLKTITSDTKFSLYLPALKSSILYTFIPTAGQAAHTQVEVLLKTNLANERDYKEAGKSTDYNEDDQNLEIYARVGDRKWVRIGLITAIDQELINAAQSANGNSAQLPELTLSSDSTVEVPVSGQEPQTFNIADLYFNKHTTTPQNQTSAKPTSKGQ